MKRTKVTVIGSINMDLVTDTKRLPNKGETVMGEFFSMIPGGKGANQAVAAARLGADVSLIGRIGEDPFGLSLRKHLEQEGITLCEGEPVHYKSTGVASITLAEGDNRIIVVPGANEEVTAPFVSQFEKIIASSDVVLLQLEIPLKAVECALSLAKKHQVRTILNPAPIRSLPNSLLKDVTYFTPNEHEVGALNIVDKAKLIVTRGEKGVTFFENDTIRSVESYPVEVVDTTGAGDAFNGAFAVALSEGKSLKEACQFSVAVGALAVTKLGAQAGMPTREELSYFLTRRDK
ncbi:ribokinase [Halalkalibacter urbisdiaboli]|uniref:ribokinase n=1 Tax=Halalkalibacter urbisdiaboli TaxID=1960589 RepID=UPI000B431051|nr:ribokinase [Halalkalibacter urbisdiaboli]